MSKTSYTGGEIIEDGFFQDGKKQPIITKEKAPVLQEQQPLQQQQGNEIVEQEQQPTTEQENYINTVSSLIKTPEPVPDDDLEEDKDVQSFLEFMNGIPRDENGKIIPQGLEDEAFSRLTPFEQLLEPKTISYGDRTFEPPHSLRYNQEKLAIVDEKNTAYAQSGDFDLNSFETTADEINKKTKELYGATWLDKSIIGDYDELPDGYKPAELNGLSIINELPKLAESNKEYTDSIINNSSELLRNTLATEGRLLSPKELVDSLSEASQANNYESLSKINLVQPIDDWIKQDKGLFNLLTSSKFLNTSSKNKSAYISNYIARSGIYQGREAEVFGSLQKYRTPSLDMLITKQVAKETDENIVSSKFKTSNKVVNYLDPSMPLEGGLGKEEFYYPSATAIKRKYDVSVFDESIEDIINSFLTYGEVRDTHGLPQSAINEIVLSVSDPKQSSYLRIAKEKASEITSNPFEDENDWKQNFAVGFQYGGRDAIPVLSSVISYYESVALSDIYQKQANSEELTLQEEELLKSAGNLNTFQALHPDSFWYEMGRRVVPQSLNFVADYMLTSGVGTAARKTAEEALEGYAKKIIKDKSLKGFSAGAVKSIATVYEHFLVRTPLSRTDDMIADIEERLLPYNSYYFDNETNSFYNKVAYVNQDTFFEAALKSYLQEGVGSITESFGEGLMKGFKAAKEELITPIATSFGKKFAASPTFVKSFFDFAGSSRDAINRLFFNYLAKVDDKFLPLPQNSKLTRRYLEDFLNGMSGKIQRAAGIQSLPAEYLEEFINNRISPLIERQEDPMSKDFGGTLLKEVMQTAVALAPIVGFSHVLQSPSYISDFKYRNNVDSKRFNNLRLALLNYNEQEFVDNFDKAQVAVNNIEDNKIKIQAQKLLQLRSDFANGALQNQVDGESFEGYTKRTAKEKANFIRINDSIEKEKITTQEQLDDKIIEHSIEDVELIKMLNEELKSQSDFNSKYSGEEKKKYKYDNYAQYKKTALKRAYNLGRTIAGYINNDTRILDFNEVEKALEGNLIPEESKDELKKLFDVAKAKQASIGQSKLLNDDSSISEITVGNVVFKKQDDGKFSYSINGVEVIAENEASEATLESIIKSNSGSINPEDVYSIYYAITNSNISESAKTRITVAFVSSSFNKMKASHFALTDQNLKGIVSVLKAYEDILKDNAVPQMKQKINEYVYNMFKTGVSSETITPEGARTFLSNAALMLDLFDTKTIALMRSYKGKLDSGKSQADSELEFDETQEITVNISEDPFSSGLQKTLDSIEVKRTFTFTKAAKVNPNVKKLKDALDKAVDLGVISVNYKHILFDMLSVLPEVFFDGIGAYNFGVHGMSYSEFDGTHDINIPSELSERTGTMSEAEFVYNFLEEIMHHVGWSIGMKLGVGLGTKISEEDVKKITGLASDSVVKAIVNHFNSLSTKILVENVFGKTQVSEMSEYEQKLFALKQKVVDAAANHPHLKRLNISEDVINDSLGRINSWMEDGGYDLERAIYYSIDFAEFFARTQADFLIKDSITRNTKKGSNLFKLLKNLTNWKIKNIYTPLLQKLNSHRELFTEESISEAGIKSRILDRQGISEASKTQIFDYMKSLANEVYGMNPQFILNSDNRIEPEQGVRNSFVRSDNYISLALSEDYEGTNEVDRVFSKLDISKDAIPDNELKNLNLALLVSINAGGSLSEEYFSILPKEGLIENMIFGVEQSDKKLAAEIAMMTVANDVIRESFIANNVSNKVYNKFEKSFSKEIATVAAYNANPLYKSFYYNKINLSDNDSAELGKAFNDIKNFNFAHNNIFVDIANLFAVVPHKDFFVSTLKVAAYNIEDSYLSSMIEDFIKPYEQTVQIVRNSFRAWHASPYKFDKFNLGNIGGGEGTQNEGLGIYLSDSEDEVEVYLGAYKNIVFYDKDKNKIDLGFSKTDLQRLRSFFNDVDTYATKPQVETNFKEIKDAFSKLREYATSIESDYVTQNLIKPIQESGASFFDLESFKYEVEVLKGKQQKDYWNDLFDMVDYLKPNDFLRISNAIKALDLSDYTIYNKTPELITNMLDYAEHNTMRGLAFVQRAMVIIGKQAVADAFKNAGYIGKKYSTEFVNGAYNYVILDPESTIDILDVKRYAFQAWHGSPHSFDKFSLSAIGSGEGVQAFGHGLYFAEQKFIAEFYAKALAKDDFLITSNNGLNKVELRSLLIRTGFRNEVYDKLYKDIIFDEDNDSDQYVKGFLMKSRLERGLEEILKIEKNLQLNNSKETSYPFGARLSKNTREENIRLLELTLDQVKNDTWNVEKQKRNLYKVEVHEGKDPKDYDYLRWEESPTENQISKILKGLKKEANETKAFFERTNFKQSGNQEYERIMSYHELLSISKVLDGQYFYRNLSLALGGDKEASKFLLSIGIDGVKYEDGHSRSKSEDKTYNYVVFDDKAVSIKEHARYAFVSNVWHGTFNDFEEFDKDKLGSNTGVPDSKEGFFFAKSKAVSESYITKKIKRFKEISKRQDEIEFNISQKLNLPQNIISVGLISYSINEDFALLDEDDNIIKLPDNFLKDNISLLKEYKDLETKYQQTWSETYESPLSEGSVLINAIIETNNPFIHDQQEQYIHKSVLVTTAKLRGHDSVIIKNEIDVNDFTHVSPDDSMTDIYVVFEPSQIKIVDKVRNAFNSYNKSLYINQKRGSFYRFGTSVDISGFMSLIDQINASNKANNTFDYLTPAQVRTFIDDIVNGTIQVPNPNEYVRTIISFYKDYLIKARLRKESVNITKKDLTYITHTPNRVDTINYKKDIDIIEKVISDVKFRNLLIKTNVALRKAKLAYSANKGKNVNFYASLKDLTKVNPRLFETFADLKQFHDYLQYRHGGISNQMMKQYADDVFNKNMVEFGKADYVQSSAAQISQDEFDAVVDNITMLIQTFGNRLNLANDEISDFIQLDFQDFDYNDLKNYYKNLVNVIRNNAVDKDVFEFTERMKAKAIYQQVAANKNNFFIDVINEKTARSRFKDVIMGFAGGHGNIKLYGIHDLMNLIDSDMREEYGGLFYNSIARPMIDNSGKHDEAMSSILDELQAPDSLKSIGAMHYLGIYGLTHQKPTFSKISNELATFLNTELGVTDFVEGMTITSNETEQIKIDAYNKLKELVNKYIIDSIIISLGGGAELGLTPAEIKSIENQMFVSAGITKADIDKKVKELKKYRGGEATITDLIKRIASSSENNLSPDELEYLNRSRNVMNKIKNGVYTDGLSMNYAADIFSGLQFSEIEDYVPIIRHKDFYDMFDSAQVGNISGIDVAFKIASSANINEDFVLPRINTISALETNLHKLITTRADQQLFYLFNAKFGKFVKKMVDTSLFEEGDSETQFNNHTSALIVGKINNYFQRGFTQSKLALRKSAFARKFTNGINNIKALYVGAVWKSPSQLSSIIATGQRLSGNDAARARDLLWGFGITQKYYYSNDLQNFLKKASPEIFYRGIGDYDLNNEYKDSLFRKYGSLMSELLPGLTGEAYKEMSNPKFRKFALASTIFFDKMAAVSSWFAAYKNYLNNNNLEFDINNINQEAADFATNATVNTQSSDNAIYRGASQLGIGIGSSDELNTYKGMENSVIAEMARQSYFSFLSFSNADVVNTMKNRRKFYEGLKNGDAGESLSAFRDMMWNFAGKITFHATRNVLTFLVTKMIIEAFGGRLDDDEWKKLMGVDTLLVQSFADYLVLIDPVSTAAQKGGSIIERKIRNESELDYTEAYKWQASGDGINPIGFYEDAVNDLLKDVNDSYKHATDGDSTDEEIYVYTSSLMRFAAFFGLGVPFAAETYELSNKLKNHEKYAN